MEVEGTGRDRVLFLLKTGGPQSVRALAKELRVTSVAIRQQLAVLDAEGVVSSAPEPRAADATPGRPARLREAHAERPSTLPGRPRGSSR